jgi:hypothetical protein
LDFRIASLEGLSEADDDPADALPEIPAGPPLSGLGDLWILGRHRVLCEQLVAAPRGGEAAQAQREKWRLARVAAFLENKV